MKKILDFLFKNFLFLEVKISIYLIYLNRRVFVRNVNFLFVLFVFFFFVVFFIYLFIFFFFFFFFFFFCLFVCFFLFHTAN